MKQHITEEQLNELSDKGKEKLDEWYYNPERARDIPWTVPQVRVPMREEYLTIEECLPSGSNWYQSRTPQLSIGEMIEFLGEDGEGYIDGTFEHKLGDSEGNWMGNPTCVAIGWDGDELCDALWEATKAILENQD